MANTETSVSNLKINRLTQTQLENASSLSNTEAYWVDPEFTGGKVLVTDSNGDIVESTVVPADIGTVKSVNNVLPVNGNITLSIPSEVTETTVTNWGFTKNTGTVTSVNNVSPVSGNVTLSIPTQASDIGAVATTDCVDLAPVGSGWAMPSDTYDDLTLGASGTEYTAPSNGYYYLSKSVNATGQGITLSLNGDVSNALSVRCLHNGSGGAAVAYIPAKKNDKVTVSYNAGGTTNIFRFYYAVGSESEAS